MSRSRAPGALVKSDNHHNCHISIPWFSFRRGDAPIDSLRRQAYAAHAVNFPKSRKRRLTNVLSWPFKSWRNALEASARWAPDARADGAPSRLEQATALWWLSVRHNMSAQAYYLHRLWHVRPGVRPPDWVDSHDSQLIYALFRDPLKARILDDKREFDAFLAHHALPGLPLLAIVSGPGEVAWRVGTGSLPRADLFVKPADGSLGQGAQAYSYDDGKSCWCAGGETFDDKALLETIGVQAGEREMLVQQRVRNHHLIADLSPDALCTLRCVTYRFHDDSARHFRSVLRMGREGRIVDHAVHGGLLAAVVGDGLLRNPRDRHVAGRLDHHPDTGAPIRGRRLPEYRAMLELALRAHDAIDIAGIISWDIALLESGPVLVEGNSRGHLDLIEMAHDEPLGRTEYVAIVERLVSERRGRG